MLAENFSSFAGGSKSFWKNDRFSSSGGPRGGRGGGVSNIKQVKVSKLPEIIEATWTKNVT